MTEVYIIMYKVSGLGPDEWPFLECMPFYEFAFSEKDMKEKVKYLVDRENIIDIVVFKVDAVELIQNPKI